MSEISQVRNFAWHRENSFFSGFEMSAIWAIKLNIIVKLLLFALRNLLENY